MTKRVKVSDLRSLLVAIEMAETRLEGIDETTEGAKETIRDIKGASRCYDFVRREIEKREKRMANVRRKRR